LADAMMESPGIPTRDTGNYFMFLFLCWGSMKLFCLKVCRSCEIPTDTVLRSACSDVLIISTYLVQSSVMSTVNVTHICIWNWNIYSCVWWVPQCKSIVRLSIIGDIVVSLVGSFMASVRLWNFVWTSCCWRQSTNAQFILNGWA
jgi:hypothetical protein